MTLMGFSSCSNVMAVHTVAALAGEDGPVNCQVQPAGSNQRHARGAAFLDAAAEIGLSGHMDAIVRSKGLAATAQLRPWMPVRLARRRDV